MSTAAAKISVSGAPIHVAFPPESSYIFTVLYNNLKWLSQNYNICFSISKEAATCSSGKNAAKNQRMKELTSLRILLFQIRRQAWSGADGQMEQCSHGEKHCRKAGKINNQDRHLTFNDRVGGAIRRGAAEKEVPKHEEKLIGVWKDGVKVTK